MSERRSWFWGRRVEDLEPALFWPYLVLSWLLVGLFLWLYSRNRSVSELVMAGLALALGLRGLLALRRRRAPREP